STKLTRHMLRILKLEIVISCCVHMMAAASYAATSSPLRSRGYTVLPAPQNVNLGAKDFEFTRAWRLELGPGIKPDDVAIQSLKRELRERFQLTLGVPGSATGVLRLAVAPNAVKVGTAEDAKKAAL